ncbi:MFS transporter [Allobranchiibius sp. CTAmp26]|uniref:MFS transporter n=1 Tax=Allobranchiibius sp. CTAmp26 TaxID=2815214 RepID=UPI0027DDBBA7|nr:MFS transporter [Allobranchiibius sp. CTAmp26]
MTDPTLRYPIGGRRAYAVWAGGLAIYVLAVFNRSSLGVAGLIAAHRFHISSAQLATFVMVQLGVYAAMQVPVGALLDRVGSKVLLSVGVVLMSLAQLAFAFAHSFAVGIIARVFVGMGDAMTFVSVLRLVALWIPPARTPLVTQMTGVIGQLGALAAATPLVAVLRGFGWETSFLIASGTGLVLGVVMVLVVKDTPYAAAERTELKLRAVARAVRLSWREPGTRLGLWCHFTLPFSSNLFTMIWGFPFLTRGEGLSSGAASLLLSLMVIVSLITSPLLGIYLGRFPYSRSTLVLSALATIVTVWTVVLLWHGPAPLWVLLVLVAVTAVGAPGSMIGFDLARSFNPLERIGSATGIVNVGGFAASLAAVFAVGVVLDRICPGGPSAYTTAGFQAALSVQYAGWALGIAMIVRYRRKTRAIVHGDVAQWAHLLPARHR